MARSRVIKPEFFHDEKLSRLDIVTRMFFVGMWTASDDFGVVKGHPQWLKAQIFPYDEITRDTLASMLEGLEKLGLVVPFVANDEQYLHIVNFTKHQRVDKPSKTRNPLPPADFCNTRETLATLSQSGSDETERETERETEKERESTAQQVAPLPPSQPVVDVFSKKIGELITEGIEAKAAQNHDQKKKNGNKPADVDEVVLELTRLVPEWPADEIALRAEQWYTSMQSKFPTSPWRISNKEVKDWKAALRNKTTYWKIELKNKNENGTHQKNSRRTAIESGAIKKFD